MGRSFSIQIEGEENSLYLENDRVWRKDRLDSFAQPARNL